MKKNLLIGIYGHPENYPPTLNAIECLAHDFDVALVFRAHQRDSWVYPIGVSLFPDGPVLSAREQEILPLWRKILIFLRFTWRFWLQIRRIKPDVLLFYDSLSILAYCIIPKIGIKRSLLWYHNHDVIEPIQTRKYSLTWWSLLAEKHLFTQLTVFSLPAKERAAYFPMDHLNGRFYLLPNFPAKSFYKQFYTSKQPANELRLLFQGQVGPSHGIEEIIQMMPLKIGELPLKLILKGTYRNAYDEWLIRRFKAKDIEDVLEIHGFTPYAEVPRLGSTCHIGLAVFTKTDLMNQSLGTASNKIYEYAALGLPIIYYDSEHFRQHLAQYSWAFPTDLTPSSISKTLEFIVNKYTALSAAAHQDFLKTLNYESQFLPIQTDLISQLQNKSFTK